MEHNTSRAALYASRWAIACFVATVMASGVGAAQGGSAPTQAKPETGKPITKEQAKELFRSVDEILTFVSNETKLPVRHSVKRRLISRDEVNRFLKQKFDEDEGAKRLEREEIVLKKFGLLDRDFQLRPFLIRLLTEQIAGFYDNKTKTVNLLDWIEPNEQKPVLAHELTHALQDQTVDLERWGNSGVHGVSQTAAEDRRHLETDELETARDAVAEGQAMAVFLGYTQKTMPTAEHPDPGGDADAAGSPVLARAPLLLQQSLLFPYADGLSFEQAVLAKSGKDAAYAGVLTRPPSSSWEIMNPEAYLEHTPVPTLQLPDVHPLLDPEYAPYDVGVMGALDVRILSELFGGREMAEALTPAWDGGIYYAAQRRAVVGAQRNSTASLAIFYLSRWKNADSARSFARMYAGQLVRKYESVKQSGTGAADDKEIYTTEEGDVVIQRAGNEVFVSEGFALPLERRLQELVLGAQASGPLLQARGAFAVREGEPSLALSKVWRARAMGEVLSRDMLVRMGASAAAVSGRAQREQQVW